MTTLYWYVDEFNGGSRGICWDTEEEARADMWEHIKTIKPTEQIIGKTVALIKGKFENNKPVKLEKIQVVVLVEDKE